MRYAITIAALAIAVAFPWFETGYSFAQSKKPDAAAVLADIIAAVPEVRGQDGKPTPTTPENVTQRVRLLAEMNAKQQRALRQAQLATLQLQEALRE